MEHTNKLAEYERLTAEIGRYQDHIFTTFSFAITASGTLFAFAYSEAVPAIYRWIILFVPWVILFPCVLLQAQRLRSTWLIGLYLKNHLEPELGLEWSGFVTRFYQRNPRNGWKKTSRYFRDYGFSTSLTLIVVQVFCPLLAIVQRPPFLLWLIVTFLIAGSLILQIVSLKSAKASPLLEKEIQEILNEQTMPNNCKSPD